MPTAQIVKWGNSLAIRIPKPVAEEAGVREGDPIVIEAEEGRIHLRRSKPRIPTLRELVAQITPENRYQEIQVGPASGKEEVEW
ncbi:MAG TPA: AbrB/MazE/SpoVT family DNA-binding domain-containing protein [Candidatus Sulfotelmatobacter sp.]|jgi:antitoxin MazE|nr:AbrB/MazE/SpoVT family DNA-binding domain-containing protein [Candidatus Sulfotelmatobacter sp.]